MIGEGFEASADAAVGVVAGQEEEEEDGEHDGGGYAVADAVVALWVCKSGVWMGMGEGDMGRTQLADQLS